MTREEREMGLWERVYEQTAMHGVGTDKADEALKGFRDAFPGSRPMRNPFPGDPSPEPPPREALPHCRGCDDPRCRQ